MIRKDVGIGVIGLGMGASVLPINLNPDSRLEVRGLCARTEAKVKGMAAQWDVPLWPA